MFKFLKFLRFLRELNGDVWRRNLSITYLHKFSADSPLVIAPLVIRFENPIVLSVGDGEMAPDQQKEMIEQISTAVASKITRSLDLVQGALNMAKQSIQELINQTVEDQAVAGKIVTGIKGLQSKLDEVNARLVAADDEEDIKALKAEHSKLSAQLAAGFAAVTPAVTEVPPVITETPVTPVTEPVV